VVHNIRPRPTVSWGGTGIAMQPTTREALDNHAPTRLYVAGRCSRSAAFCAMFSRGCRQPDDMARRGSETGSPARTSRSQPAPPPVRRLAGACLPPRCFGAFLIGEQSGPSRLPDLVL
jgi:hypothetical protein